MKVVPDANVLLAAYGFGGTCRELIELCLTRHEIVVSEHILWEFLKHLQGKFHVHPDQAKEIVEHFRSGVMCVTPAEVKADACSDPNDLPVLGTLIAAKAHCLITGDKVLLNLKLFHGCPILSPREFLDCQP
jgi:putative PIN family toxin of toxin-antitoxin system